MNTQKEFQGYLKAEFQGKRMIALTSKCYFADCGAGGEAGAKLGASHNGTATPKLNSPVKE